jgi:hypothetical protein
MKLFIKADTLENNPNYEIGALKAQWSGFVSNLNRILHLEESDAYKFRVLQIAIQKEIEKLENLGIKVTPPSAYKKLV